MAEQNLIVGLVRDEPFMVSDYRVIKPAGPNEAMQQVLDRAKKITEVDDEASQHEAAKVAGELQGLRKGLEAQYNNAKQPIRSAGRALDNVLHELDGPLKEQYRRIDQLVSAYQDQLRRKAELAKALAEAKQREAERLEREKLIALQRAKEQAELKARLAESAKERRQAELQAKALAPKIEEQQIAIELEAENVPIVFEDPPAKPQGGRVWTQYNVEMVDDPDSILALAQEHPELVKITLKQAAAQEFAKALDEAGKPLICRGLRIQKQTRTSFQGAAAIRIDNE